MAPLGLSLGLQESTPRVGGDLAFSQSNRSIQLVEQAKGDGLWSQTTNNDQVIDKLLNQRQVPR